MRTVDPDKRKTLIENIKKVNGVVRRMRCLFNKSSCDYVTLRYMIPVVEKPEVVAQKEKLLK